MSRTKFDSILRTALWNTHKNNCFYCGNDLAFSDINIDHIIPEHLANRKDEFEKIKVEYALPNDFDVNKPYNLVPTHSRCNNRKSGQLFQKKTALFFLELANAKLNTVEKEIKILRARKNKGQLLARLHAALESNLLDIKELEKLTTEAKLALFHNKEIKLNRGFEFMDSVYDSFYLDADLSYLYDKILLINNEEEGLELISDNGEETVVFTLNQWQRAIESGFYPGNTYSIKMAANFTFLENFLDAVKMAQMPKYSFISEPWVSLTDLETLSPMIIQDPESHLTAYIKAGKSVADLIKLGVVKKNHSDYFDLVLEFNYMETYLTEQFRADFNGDGFEGIFVKGWVRAIGGTLGYGFNTILSKHSKDGLLEVSEKTNQSEFKITLWCDINDGRTEYHFQNDGDEPLMDAVFYIDKIGKTEEERLRSRHTMEIVFGTIPPRTILSHRMNDEIDQELFGFPLFSGEFTSKTDQYYLIDHNNNVAEIPHRSSFD